MDINLSYRDRMWGDMSVAIDFKSRRVTGPGARLLLDLIKRFDENPRANQLIRYPWRDPIRITHPWAGVMDMVAVMLATAWSDPSQWPKELLDTLPPDRSHERADGFTVF